MQDYYNPFKSELKEERLELINDESISGVRYLKFFLHSKENYAYTCPNCNSTDITKYGIRERIIKREILQNVHTHMVIKVQRFKCMNCSSIFQDECNLIEKNSNIPIQTKIQVMIDLEDIVSFKSVAKKHSLDLNTVDDIFTSLYEPPIYDLPDTLCFDERKNIRGAEGNYMFIILDPINFKVIDILKSRESSVIKRYLYNIDIKSRERVKYIVIDMYYPYKEIVYKLFPNAKIVVDAFHYIRYMTNALNDIRIRIQESFDYKSQEYKILKNNWNLILLRKSEIDFNHLKYNPIKKEKTSIFKLLDDILNISEELSNAYNIYQSFLRNIDTVHYEDSIKYLDELINTLNNSGLEEYKEVAKTYSNWKIEISNSFIKFGDKRLSNGPIEGLNDIIDHIIEVSFGYKKFETLRKRIIYCVNKDIKIRPNNIKKYMKK